MAAPVTRRMLGCGPWHRRGPADAGEENAVVVLSRIYTKTGDNGTTALGDGRRVPKDHPRIAAYGTVDELHSVLGLVIASGLDAAAAARLRSLQTHLLD